MRGFLSVIPSLLLLICGPAAAFGSEERPGLNRLADEKSPYLLQHAANPVDWYPWGEEAFRKAREEGKLIFLSIGYSTCHWCHVMEEESFSRDDVAALLNERFVSVKVDREERPDVDQLYMTYLQATTGSGGWPLNVILTPELEPVFGGTYFPPEDRDGMAGLIPILEKISSAWSSSPESLEALGRRTMEMLRAGANRNNGKESLEAEVLSTARDAYARSFDESHGGFGGAPKFPQPVDINFLLRYHARTGDARALMMVRKTLDAIAAGGIYDHLGGGFHRYAVDRAWRVPHFEKMLYDQAQLVSAFLDASLVADEPAYRDVARETLDYLLDRMQSREGGFYSAEDAVSLDAEGARREGAFYVWKADELEELLGRDSPVVAARFGVEEVGNVPPELDPRDELKGVNVLRVAESYESLAERFDLSPSAVEKVVEASLRKLRQARLERPAPLLDDKILTSWNGLAISAFSRGAAVLGDERYRRAAVAAARFLERELIDQNEKIVLRRYRGGDAGIEAFADDYAFLIQGLLDLYEVTFDPRWLELSVKLQGWMDEKFFDSERGEYSRTSGSDPWLPWEGNRGFDAAEPSHNSIAALNLLRLGEITDDDEMRSRGKRVIEAAGQVLVSNPVALPQMLVALDYELAKPKQIVIAGSPGDRATEVMVDLVHQRFIPTKVLLLADGGEGQKRLARWLPFVENMTTTEGFATVFICENYICRLPSSDPEEVAAMLDAIPLQKKETENASN